jgi:cell pole-organizing protein PopZ
MTQPAKAAQEPTMEEILASIRRIIADDDTSKTPAKPVDPMPPAPTPLAARRPEPVVPPIPPRPAAAPEPSAKQAEVDAMLAGLDTAPPPPPEPRAEEPAPDVLDLTESMAASAAPASGFRTIDGQSDVVFDEHPSQPPEPPSMEPAYPGVRRDAPTDVLVSSATSAAVDSAFNSLAHTVLVQNARTLEDLVREMLRPLLKTWLDDNLPGLVERLVRAEIERVSRGRSS